LFDGSTDKRISFKAHWWAALNDSNGHGHDRMKSFLLAYTAAVAAFLVLDGLWLGVIAKSFYSNHLEDLLRRNFLILPAVLFYLIYNAGLVFLAVRPGQLDVSLGSVALHGAIVGFLAYGTYDMTNLATLKDWPAIVSVVDIIWGSVLSATVATFSALCLRHFA
jgi:uncharacterized membrane protein